MWTTPWHRKIWIHSSYKNFISYTNIHYRKFASNASRVCWKLNYLHQKFLFICLSLLFVPNEFLSFFFVYILSENNSLSSYLRWFRFQNHIHQVRQTDRGVRRVPGLSLIAMTRPASCCRLAATSEQSELLARARPPLYLWNRRYRSATDPFTAEEPRPSAFLSENRLAAIWLG